MTDTEITDFKIGVKESIEIPEIEDGTYPANLKKMGLEVNIPDGKGGTFDKINWYFDIEGKELRAQSSAIISEKSKAYTWIKAITGKDLPVKTDFSPSMIVGKSCQVLVEHKEQSREFNGKTEKISYPQVTKVLPAKKK